MSSNEAGAQAPAVVTVRFLTATGPYMPRDIAAFPRDIVDVYLKRGAAEIYRPDAPAPAEAAHPEPEATPPPPPAQPNANTSGVVTIPDDWQTSHHLVRLRLAKEIVKSDESLTVERADEIIKTELDRRAVAGEL